MCERPSLFPGELVWGAWDAFVCATSDKTCTADERSLMPRWRTFVKVSELKGIDKRITRVFGKKKPQIIAGSFFAAGGSVVAAVRGNAGTLGIFSVVLMLWPLLSSTDATPQSGLLVYTVLAWQTTSITQARAAAAKRKKKMKKKRAAAADENKNTAAAANKREARDDISVVKRWAGESSKNEEQEQEPPDDGDEARRAVEEVKKDK